MEAVPDFKLSKMMTQVNRKKNRKSQSKTKLKMKKHTNAFLILKKSTNQKACQFKSSLNQKDFL